MDIRNIEVGSSELNEYKKLYLEAFPSEERLDFELLTAKVKDGKGNFLGLFNENSIAGIMYYSEYRGIVYIFYFAIKPEHQSKGYGKMMLEYMFERYNKHKMILLVEELDEKAENIGQRIRRKNFYLRNGFADNGQFLTALGTDFELIHRQGNTAYVSDYKEIKEYYYSDSV